MRSALPAVVLLLLGCVRGVAPAASDERAELRLRVQLDESYREVEVALTGEDGGVLLAQRFDRSAQLVDANDWHRGRGRYALELRYLRSDGGTGLHATSFELGANDVLVDASASLWGHRREPQLQLEVVERTPPGFALQRSSKVSREGRATYVLTNTTSRTLFPGFTRLDTEQHAAHGWGPVSSEPCVGPEAGRLEPGQRLVLDSTAAACLSPLSPGRYRHSIRLHTVEPAPAWQTFDDDAEVTRSIEVSSEFEIDGTEVSMHALSEVPVSEVTLGTISSGPRGFVAEVVAPNGRTACVCPGDALGREGLRVTRGIGGPCVTADLDASVVCDPIDVERRNLGDHPPFSN